MKLNALVVIPAIFAVSFILLCFFIGLVVLIDEVRVWMSRRRASRAERVKRIERLWRDYNPDADGPTTTSKGDAS